MRVHATLQQYPHNGFPIVKQGTRKYAGNWDRSILWKKSRSADRTPIVVNTSHTNSMIVFRYYEYYQLSTRDRITGGGREILVQTLL